MDEPIARIVRTPRCYLVARGDGRVVLGATMEEQGFDTTVTADGVYRLLEAAWEVLPEVGELELVEARAGPAAGHARQPPAGRSRARRLDGPGLGHRPLAQRRAARPAHRRARGRPARGRAPPRGGWPRSRPSASRAAERRHEEGLRQRRVPRAARRRHRRVGRAASWAYAARSGGGGGRRGGAARRVGRAQAARRPGGRGAARGPGRRAGGVRARRPDTAVAPDPRHRRLSQPRDDGARRREPRAPSWPRWRCAAWTRPRAARSSRCSRRPGSTCCPTPPAASPRARP